MIGGELSQKMPRYFTSIPANVRYDERLSFFTRLIYSEINYFCWSFGKCTLRDSYFENHYNVSRRTVRRAIQELKDYEFIEVEGRTRQRILKII